MKSILILIIILAGAFTLDAQTKTSLLPAADRKQLSRKEDSLQVLSDSMVNAIAPAGRFRSDSTFIKTFVRALKTRHSFYYPFDSLQTVSKLYPPDSSFRIFTWQ